MAESRAANRVPVRFRPGERRGLMESLGAEVYQYRGLSLAELDRSWHVCWLLEREAAALEARLSAPGSPLPTGPRVAVLERLAVRPGQEQRRRSRSESAGLLLATLFLCGPDEPFSLPPELVASGPFREFQDDGDGELARLGRQLARHADVPLRSLGGLSARAFGRLVSADWLGPGSVLELSLDLAPSELEGVPALERARALLNVLARREPLAADGRGRLPMGLVLELAADPLWQERPGVGVWTGNGLPSEDTIAPILTARAGLQAAGLLRLRRGHFSLTPLGRALRQVRAGGELYARIFEARLQRAAGLPGSWRAPARRFHRAMAYHLHRLLLAPEGEHLADWLSDWVALPAWLYGRDPSGRPLSTAPLVHARLLAPLTEFGLLCRRRPSRGRRTAGQWVYVATPLLSRLIRVWV